MKTTLECPDTPENQPSNAFLSTSREGGAIFCPMPICLLICLFFSMALEGCVLVHPEQHGSSCTGVISGSVVDSHSRPVAGAEVEAIYLRGWTIVFPPVPNAFVVGGTRTDVHGQFRLVTSKRVDQLAARAADSLNSGELFSVIPENNVIRLRLTTRP